MDEKFVAFHMYVAGNESVINVVVKQIIVLGSFDGYHRIEINGIQIRSHHQLIRFLVCVKMSCLYIPQWIQTFVKNYF
jgi:hypothetical protein